MVLSELTNKELKGILQENDVKNYSNLNKKELVKKVNQLIKAQNGGKSGKGKNGKKKKYALKDLIGGEPPEMPPYVNPNILPNIQTNPPPPPLPLKKSVTSNAQVVTAQSKNSATSNSQVVKAQSKNSAPSNLQVVTAQSKNSAISKAQEVTAQSNNSAPSNAQAVTAPLNPKIATAPPYSKFEQNALIAQEENRQFNNAIERSLKNQGGIKNDCGPCSIL
jgi:hypothetical protein